MQPDERAVTEEVNRVVHVGVGVFVDHGRRVEQRLVPRNADREVADGKRHVRQSGKRCHVRWFLSRCLGR
jgi:hypothetical protein